MTAVRWMRRSGFLLRNTRRLISIRLLRSLVPNRRRFFHDRVTVIQEDEVGSPFKKVHQNRYLPMAQKKRKWKRFDGSVFIVKRSGQLKSAFLRTARSAGVDILSDPEALSVLTNIRNFQIPSAVTTRSSQNLVASKGNRKVSVFRREPIVTVSGSVQPMTEPIVMDGGGSRLVRAVPFIGQARGAVQASEFPVDQKTRSAHQGISQPDIKRIVRDGFRVNDYRSKVFLQGRFFGSRDEQYHVVPTVHPIVGSRSALRYPDKSVQGSSRVSDSDRQDVFSSKCQEIDIRNWQLSSGRMHRLQARCVVGGVDEIAQKQYLGRSVGFI